MDAAPDAEHFELPYHRWRIILGYLAAVLTAFPLSWWLTLTSIGIFNTLNAGGMPSLETLASPFGLFLRMPFVFSFSVGSLCITAIVVGALAFPTWRWFARRGHTRFADAARAGAVAGGIIVAFEIAGIVWVLVAQTEIYGPNAMTPLFNVSGLPPHWLALKILFDCTCTIGIGAVAGLATWAVAGPPIAKGPARRGSASDLLDTVSRVPVVMDDSKLSTHALEP